MPTCIVCHTKAYYQTRLDPAEPCDCGLNWFDNRESAEEEPPDPVRLAEARRRWAAGEDMEAEA